MGARITAIERVSDQHEVRLEAREKNEEYIWKSVSELREALHSQGVRLAILFGGINVVVIGVGFLIGFAKIMNALQGR